jgi:hypothetical protein
MQLFQQLREDDKPCMFRQLANEIAGTVYSFFSFFTSSGPFWLTHCGIFHWQFGDYCAGGDTSAFVKLFPNIRAGSRETFLRQSFAVMIRPNQHRGSADGGPSRRGVERGLGWSDARTKLQVSCGHRKQGPGYAIHPIMPQDERGYLIVPHEIATGADCDGCLIVEEHGDVADLRCNSCGAVVDTVPLHHVGARRGSSLPCRHPATSQVEVASRASTGAIPAP